MGETMSGLIWAHVPFFEGEFQVSSHGQVFDCELQRVIKPFHKYKNNAARASKLEVAIHDERKLVARLVAETFVPNPESYNYLEHLDGDYTNCRADNLVWVKRKAGGRLPTPLVAYEIIEIKGCISIDPYAGEQSDLGSMVQQRPRTISTKELALFSSYPDAAKQLGVSPEAVGQAVKNGTKCKGVYLRKL